MWNFLNSGRDCFFGGGLFVFLHCLLAASILAQPDKIPVEQISVEHGLASNLVTGILQDSRGFMWFGTNTGLHRFDGYGFVVYKPEPTDTNSMSHLNSSELFEDGFGDIWVNATGNINRLDRISGKVTRVLQGLWSTTLCEDTSQGRGKAAMWIATYGSGLYRWDRDHGSKVHYQHNPSDPITLSSDSVVCVSAEAEGRVWVGTSNGLNLLDGASGHVTRYPTGPKDKVYVLLRDSSLHGKVVWIGAGDGLYRYDKKSGTFDHYKNPFAKGKNPNDNEVRTLFRDRKGILWVGMVGGIAGFDPVENKFLTYQNDVGSFPWAYITRSWIFAEDLKGTLWSIAHGGYSSTPLRWFDRTKKRWSEVRSTSGTTILGYALCIDSLGSIWLGTTDRGVLKIDANRKPFFNYLTKPDGEFGTEAPAISGIAEDSSGTIWLGSSQGLLRFDPDISSFTRYVHDPHNAASLGEGKIGPVVADRHGGIWMGLMDSGLDRLETKNGIFTHFIHHSNDSGSLSENNVTSLRVARDGRIWAATVTGTLDEFIPETHSFKHHRPDLPTEFRPVLVYGLVEDRNSLMWYILRGAGLLSFRRSDQSFQRYANAPSPYSPPLTLATIGLSSLHADSRNDLWIGTDLGLVHYEPGSGNCSVIGERDGIPPQYIWGILEDGKGNLWIGGTQGISEVDPKTNKVRSFSAVDGIDFGQCISSTGCKTRDGEMYFGGNRGFIQFHPDSIKYNPNIPRIVITGFKKFGRDALLDTVISEKKVVVVSYNENVIAFEFASLNYSATAKNQYAYKLEGFDNDWVHCGTRRSVTYTNLDGKSYVFRVKGSNNDGLWNEEGTSIVLIVTPPWWKTWWFRIPAFIVLFGIVGGVARYVEISRLRRRMRELEYQQAMERERVRISGDLHDELASNLTSIAMLSKILNDENSPSAEHIDRPQLLERITTLSSQSVESIRDIIWAIDSKNETLGSLLTRLHDMLVSLCRAKNIRLDFQWAAEQLPSADLQPEFRRNLWLLLKEAVNNALKHSGCTQLTLTVHYVNGILHVEVRDNGAGYDARKVSEGKGLRTMKTRAEQIGGRLSQTSAPGAGTTVLLEVKIPNRTN